MTPDRMAICNSCGGQTAQRSNGPSSYRERLSAPIFERVGEFGFAAKIPFPMSVIPEGGFVVLNSRQMTAHQARSLANALNSVADVVDQLNNNWKGPGPADAYLERQAAPQADDTER